MGFSMSGYGHILLALLVPQLMASLEPASMGVCDITCNMFLCICLHMYVCTHVNIHIYTCIYIYVCTYTHIYIHIHVYICI